MSWLGSWIYWLQFIGICVAAAVAFLVAVQIFGWNRMKGFLLPALGLLAVFGYRAKIQQAAYQDRVVEEEKALDKAEEIVDEKRDEIKRLPDQEVDERLDKWTRP